MHDAPVISVAALSKRFGGGVLAVDDLTFEVAQGQVCGMLGPNGAGKTTTLRVLLGLVRPTSGRVSIFGTRITPSAPVLSRVGTVIEQAAFVPYLSGMRNLKVWWEGAGTKWPPPGLDRALDIAGLGPAIDRKVKTYSLGMHQRLGVALCTARQSRSSRARRADCRPRSAGDAFDPSHVEGHGPRRCDGAALESPAHRDRGSVQLRRRHGSGAAHCRRHRRRPDERGRAHRVSRG